LIPGYDPFATAGNCTLDEAAAQLAIDFFPECLSHIEGKLAGAPFKLEPWQQAIVGNLFGWKRPDGTRRYREAMIYVPRKNGKTPLAAGIANYVLFCDDEKGQQNICAAAEREQASLLYRHARGMVENEPELLRRAKIYAGLGQRSIAIESEHSAFKVISADADSKHGGNLHLGIIDELHVQPNRDLVDVIQTSMASKNRRQPLLIYITTADFDRESICNEKHDYACKVRDGVIVDPAFLPVIYEAMVDDDWTSPDTWRRVNPNYGVSVDEEYMLRECKRAQESAAYENTFKRLHLNVKTQNDVRWLKLESWDNNDDAIDETALAGRPCYSALDLSTKTDITANAHLFPPTEDDPKWRVLMRFWIPGENARIRERRDRVPYEAWAKQGFITLTDGNVIDYDIIKASILEDGRKFEVREIAYDPWNATQIALQLQAEGATAIEFGQGYRSMSEPTKELEKLVLAGAMAHGGNPVLRWMASNVSVEQDPAGNLKPSKKKSTERIDGIVALVMALGRAMVNPAEAASVYETRGLIAL
jgi:phage terminase large subunit-like protein